MRFLALTLLALAGLSRPADAAVLEVGDKVPNLCWKDAAARAVCLTDHDRNVRVLVYNTGWCPSCNDEMTELARRVVEFEGRPVTFLSLSAEGFEKGSPPDAAFLAAWREKHKIPFAVLASPKDAGKHFWLQTRIPNIAVVDRAGRLAYKAIMPGVDRLFAELNAIVGP